MFSLQYYILNYIIVKCKLVNYIKDVNTFQGNLKPNILLNIFNHPFFAQTYGIIFNDDALLKIIYFAFMTLYPYDISWKKFYHAIFCSAKGGNQNWMLQTMLSSSLKVYLLFIFTTMIPYILLPNLKLHPVLSPNRNLKIQS